MIFNSVCILVTIISVYLSFIYPSFITDLFVDYFLDTCLVSIKYNKTIKMLIAISSRPVLCPQMSRDVLNVIFWHSVHLLRFYSEAWNVCCHVMSSPPQKGDFLPCITHKSLPTKSFEGRSEDKSLFWFQKFKKWTLISPPIRKQCLVFQKQLSCRCNQQQQQLSAGVCHSVPIQHTTHSNPVIHEPVQSSVDFKIRMSMLSTKLWSLKLFGGFCRHFFWPTFQNSQIDNFLSTS